MDATNTTHRRGWLSLIRQLGGGDGWQEEGFLLRQVDVCRFDLTPTHHTPGAPEGMMKAMRARLERLRSSQLEYECPSDADIKPERTATLVRSS